jgi:hypothetical protein
MALFGLIGAWNYSAETARSAVGGAKIGANRHLISVESGR